MSVFKWKDLTYWKSGEWQVIEERLDDMEKQGKYYCPSWDDLFLALKLTKFENTKVVVLGQDPYIDPSLATGLAFSIPPKKKQFPPTLRNIFTEYQSDLGHPLPTSGCLKKWADRGVLLWNCIPSAPMYGPAMGHNWPEWMVLTEEILEKLREKGTVFVLMGNHARVYADMFDGYMNCRVIETTHPSPRGNMKRNQSNSFLGSRVFSRINAALVEIGHDPIDWKL